MSTCEPDSSDEALQAALASLVRDIGGRRALTQLRKRPARAPDRAAVLARHGGVCVYCDRRLSSRMRWHVDHLTPRSRGGGDDDANLVAACAACNLAKRDYLGYICHACDGYAWADPSETRHIQVCGKRIAKMLRGA